MISGAGDYGREPLQGEPLVEGGTVQEAALTLALLPSGARTDVDIQALGPKIKYPGSMIDLIGVAESEQPDLLVIDVASINQSTCAWLVRLRHQLQRPAIMLLSTAGEFCQTTRWAQMLCARVIYPMLGWRTRDDWPIWRRWAVSGCVNEFISSALGASGGCASQSLRALPVPRAVKLDDPIWYASLEALGLPRELATDVQLCAEELVNNAFAHGGGALLGGSGSAVQPLRVEVAVGSCHDRMVLQVRDSAGRMSSYRALTSLARQWGASGTLDEQGRGIYLAHTLGSGLLLHFNPGASTELTLLFDRERARNVAVRELHPIGFIERGA